MVEPPSFVVATPGHCHFDEDKARALTARGRLRFLAKATRRGADGVPAEQTRRNLKIGLVFTAAAKTLSTFRAESIRFRLNPWFDHWVRKQLRPGDHIISSYGYANDSFKWVRRNGGKTILSAGNSHPENFWALLSEEHRRWQCPDPPIAPEHQRRALAMLEDVDYVTSPSSFVTDSFVTRGFKPEQILRDIYTIDLSCFTPATAPRPKDQPLTVVSTGSLSLRKGSPYLLEAFRLVLKKHPSARLRLTERIQDNMLPVLAKYRDLPIDWAPGLPHPQLAERLRSSDIYVLPSLEEGQARTTIEALACGLPVIITDNTGAGELVRNSPCGELVPIRDPAAIADGICKWAEKILGQSERPKIPFDASAFSFDAFQKLFLDQLKDRGLL